jgi:hypothetical protein
MARGFSESQCWGEDVTLRAVAGTRSGGERMKSFATVDLKLGFDHARIQRIDRIRSRVAHLR